MLAPMVNGTIIKNVMQGVGATRRLMLFDPLNTSQSATAGEIDASLLANPDMDLL